MRTYTVTARNRETDEIRSVDISARGTAQARTLFRYTHGAIFRIASIREV